MAFIDIGGDDDDEDEYDPSEHKNPWWHGGGGHAIKADNAYAVPAQDLKNRARGGGAQAQQQLQARQNQVASGPMMQRGRKMKKGAAWTAGGANVAGLGLGAANTAMGGALLGGATLSGATGWVALGGGASLLAGPFALLAAGTALSLGGSVRQGRAAYKTHQHIKMLESILAQADSFSCAQKQGFDHSEIVTKILPYIIAKKKKKRIRKAIRTVPLVGSIETARSMLKKIEKWELNTHGKNRSWHAQRLAHHHVTTDCSLTKAIIAELFSVEENVAEQARYLEVDMLAKVLERKMKSV